MSDAVLDVRGVTRWFGALRAVDSLSFELQRGQVWGFVGPNGSGKTTTMRIISTLDVPDVGDVFVEGRSVLEEPRQVRRRIGFMADQFVAYNNLNVREFLDFFARAYGLSGRTRVETVNSLAGFCGLETFFDRPSTGLSKGMGQRLHLAKTLLHDPAVLILDEPTAGLDPRARIDFRELVRELASRGKSILISSHILSELAEMCDGVVVIERGRRVVAGDIRDIGRQIHGAMKVRVRVVREADVAEQFFLVQPGVEDVIRQDLVIDFRFGADEIALSETMTRACAAGLGLIEFRLLEAGLEEIFMKATQGNLQ